MELNQRYDTKIIELQSGNILILSPEKNGVCWNYRKLDGVWDRIESPDVQQTLNELGICYNEISVSRWMEDVLSEDLIQLKLLGLDYDKLNINEWISTASPQVVQKLRECGLIDSVCYSSRVGTALPEHQIEISLKYIDLGQKEISNILSAISLLLSSANIQNFRLKNSPLSHNGTKISSPDKNLNFIHRDMTTA